MDLDFLHNNRNKIRTYTGKLVDVFNITEDDIDILDIAHSLSMQCRFNGHIRSFYSVAEHSIFVADNVPDEDKLCALLHDASETYIADIPSPIKAKLDYYKSVEDKIQAVIAKKFGFPYPFPKTVHVADKLGLEYEWKHKVLDDTVISMSSGFAETSFLLYFDKLINLKNNE